MKVIQKMWLIVATPPAPSLSKSLNCHLSLSQGIPVPCNIIYVGNILLSRKSYQYAMSERTGDIWSFSVTWISHSEYEYICNLDVDQIQKWNTSVPIKENIHIQIMNIRWLIFESIPNICIFIKSIASNTNIKYIHMEEKQYSYLNIYYLLLNIQTRLPGAVPQPLFQFLMFQVAMLFYWQKIEVIFHLNKKNTKIFEDVFHF